MTHMGFLGGGCMRERSVLRIFTSWLLLGALVLVLLTGCASLRETRALNELYRLEADAYTQGDVSTSGGGPDLSEDATLSDYLAYAAINNPGLEAAFSEWKAALERIPQVRALPDPRFTYVHYIQSVETRVGSQEQSYALVQTFPWLGKLKRQGEMALREAEAVRQRYEAAKLSLFYQVKHAYYEYYYLGRAIAVMEANIMLVSNLEEVARAKYQVGAVPYAALVKAQVELGKLEDALTTLEDLRGPTVARLNTALGRAPESYLPWPGPIGTEPVDFSDEEIYSDLKANNPELVALDFMTERQEAAVGLSTQTYFPDLTLGAAFIRTGDALDPEMEASGKDPVMASLSLNLPIWVGKYRAAGREARARLRAAEKRRRDREHQLLTDLKLAFFHFRSAERKTDLYGDSLIPKAEQALAASQRAFAVGKADFFDLIEADRTLLEFQLAYERALADRAQKLAEIEMLSGKQIAPEAD
jgi:cobalt-zinc-cadmium efflux system outer membrane protein